jgi:hypothetical protein
MPEVPDFYPPGIYRMSNGELRLAGWYDKIMRTYMGSGWMDFDSRYFKSQRHIPMEALEDDMATLVISIEDIMKMIRGLENA